MSTSKSIITDPNQKIWEEITQSVLNQLKVQLSPEWRKPFLSGSRLIFAMGGEGSGKSFHGGLFGVCKSFYDKIINEGPKLYWVIGADYQDARSDFMKLFDFETRLDNVKVSHVPYHEDNQCILETKTGDKFVTISAYDVTKVAREEPDGILGAEIARWPSEEVFLRCEGRLARKYPHAWGWFTGSFESSMGWVPNMYKYGLGPNERGIRSYSIPSWANRWVYPGGRDDKAIKMLEEANSPQRFMERYGGEPSPAKALIMSEFRNHLHVDIDLEYNPSLPVYLAIDPGTKVYCVLFVQITPDGGVNILDEIYVNRWTNEQVINESMARPGWPLVQGGVIDIAARQNHMGMGIPLDDWYTVAGVALHTGYHTIEETIERLRLALSNNPTTGRPRLRIHPKCRGIISEMGGGASPVEDGGPWMYYETRAGLGPPISKNDHACKALGYLLSGPFGFSSYSYKPSRGGSVSYLRKENRNTWDNFIKEFESGRKS